MRAKTGKPRHDEREAWMVAGLPDAASGPPVTHLVFDYDPTRSPTRSRTRPRPRSGDFQFIIHFIHAHTEDGAHCPPQHRTRLQYRTQYSLRMTEHDGHASLFRRHHRTKALTR
jgi:hypothetical protein